MVAHSCFITPVTGDLESPPLSSAGTLGGTHIHVGTHTYIYKKMKARGENEEKERLAACRATEEALEMGVSR